MSLSELAILDFTNDGFIDSRDHYWLKHETPLVLTTKTAYIWPMTVAKLLDVQTDFDADKIINAYKNVLKYHTETILLYYSQLTPRNDDHKILFAIYSDFLFHLGLPDDIDGINNIYKSVNTTYESLIKKGLIEDPVFTTIFGVSVAILGFFPYGFTQRTRLGKTVYRKIDAAFWSYEMKEERGQKITKVQFRLLKILRALKTALAESMEETTEKPKG